MTADSAENVKKKFDEINKLWEEIKAEEEDFYDDKEIVGAMIARLVLAKAEAARRLRNKEDGRVGR